MEKRKGFSVGPANLPDGVHRRKVQKIKTRLIRKAEIRKSYNKLKTREPELFHTSENATVDSASAADTLAAAPLELHPERQALLDDEVPQSAPKEVQNADHKTNGRYQRQSRSAPFRKEEQIAKQMKDKRTAQLSTLEQANREREVQRAEREKFRKAMMKAKTGGKSRNERRLGRESQALLEKVQRMVQG